MAIEGEATAAIERVAEIAASVVENDNAQVEQARATNEALMQAQMERLHEERLTAIETRLNGSIEELRTELRACQNELATLRMEYQTALSQPPAIVIAATEPNVSTLEPSNPSSQPENVEVASPVDAPVTEAIERDQPEQKKLPRKRFL